MSTIIHCLQTDKTPKKLKKSELLNYAITCSNKQASVIISDISEIANRNVFINCM